MPLLCVVLIDEGGDLPCCFAFVGPELLLLLPVCPALLGPGLEGDPCAPGGQGDAPGPELLQILPAQVPLPVKPEASILSLRSGSLNPYPSIIQTLSPRFCTLDYQAWCPRLNPKTLCWHDWHQKRGTWCEPGCYTKGSCAFWVQPAPFGMR